MNNKIKLVICTITIILTSSTFSIASYNFWENNKDSSQQINIQEAKLELEKMESNINTIIDNLKVFDIKNKESTNQKYKEIRENIITTIDDMKKAKTITTKKLETIENYQKMISETNKDIKQGTKDIENTRENFEKFLIILQQNNNKYLNNKNNVDITKLINQSDNIADTLVEKKMIENITKELNWVMENLNTDQRKQLKILTKLNTLKQQNEQEIQKYYVMIKSLNKKEWELMYIIKLYEKWAIDKLETINVYQNRKEINNSILSLVKSITQKKYTVWFDIEKKLKELNTQYNKDKNIKHELWWPTYPIQEIEFYFKDNNFYNEYNANNLWIQIIEKEQTPVYSANDGIIYAINEENSTNKWILILHPDSYITTYIYLDKTTVIPWQIVKRWELIGFAGGKITWKTNNTIMKPNLNFWIFKDWISIDPFQIMDLSVIENKKIIPSEYNIKYLNDKYIRTIDISEVSFLKGDSLEEREKNFLNSYGVGIYKDINFRNDVAKWTNIDKDVLICIGFSESTLGRYLSSQNNIGNVGNDDSGNRINYSSEKAWAKAIAYTLNNKYLWWYHTIKQLSRYWNAEWMIYASSDTNRQVNMIKCLSRIKGYYVPEDYPFRIWLNPNKK